MKPVNPPLNMTGWWECLSVHIVVKKKKYFLQNSAVIGLEVDQKEKWDLKKAYNLAVQRQHSFINTICGWKWIIFKE